MIVLIWLNDLIGLPVDAGHDADGILDAYPRAYEIRERHEEVDSLLLPAVQTLRLEMSRPATADVCTRRKRDNHVPAVV